MHGQIDQELARDSNVVIAINFTDCNAHYWLVIEPGDVSVCLTDPGLVVDVVLTSTLRTMYLVWLGRIEIGSALLAGDIELAGDPAIVSAFARSLRLSPVSGIVRAAAAMRST